MKKGIKRHKNKVLTVMVQDKLSDMLTRIRNAQLAKHTTVEVFNTKTNRKIAEILNKTGFIKAYSLPPKPVTRQMFKPVTKKITSKTEVSKKKRQRIKQLIAKKKDQVIRQFISKKLSSKKKDLAKQPSDNVRQPVASKTPLTPLLPKAKKTKKATKSRISKKKGYEIQRLIFKLKKNKIKRSPSKKKGRKTKPRISKKKYDRIQQLVFKNTGKGIKNFVFKKKIRVFLKPISKHEVEKAIGTFKLEAENKTSTLKNKTEKPIKTGSLKNKAKKVIKKPIAKFSISKPKLLRLKNSVSNQKSLIRICKQSKQRKRFKLGSRLIHPRKIKISLKYSSQAKIPCISKIQRISTPNLPLYSGYKDLPKALNGMGTVILTTSKGIMTDHEAKQNKLGGKLLCSVY